MEGEEGEGGLGRVGGGQGGGGPLLLWLSAVLMHPWGPPRPPPPLSRPRVSVHGGHGWGPALIHCIPIHTVTANQGHLPWDMSKDSPPPPHTPMAWRDSD